MIKIYLSNGDVVTWERNEYTRYEYINRCFVVINGFQWVGIYNMEWVVRVEIDKDNNAENPNDRHYTF